MTDSFTIAPDSFPAIATLGPLDTSFCAGNQIALLKGAPQARTYFWSTGSNNSSINIQKSGTYYLTVTDVNACLAKDSIAVTIKGVAPVAAFSETTSPTCQNTAVSFLDKSKDTVSGDFIKTWQWDFGDLTNSTAQNPIHLYQSPKDTGIFNVNLLITSNSGCYNTFGIPVHIYPRPHVSFPNSTVCNGYDIKFSSSDSLFGYTAKTYYWNFGTGATDSSNVANPYHRFVNAGNYTVKATISNDQGCVSDTLIRLITVNPSPVADFMPSLACKGQQVSFKDQSTSISAIQNHKIVFGDNTPPFTQVSVQNLTHTYADTGTFQLIIIDSANNGCVDTFKTNVNVHSLPIDTFTIIGPKFCTNAGIGFSSQAYIFPPEKINHWNWVFDGSQIVQSPVDSFVTQQFSTSGFHTAELIATSSSGCKDTSQIQSFNINTLPNSKFSVSPFSGSENPPLTVYFKPDTSSLAYSWSFGDPVSSANSSNLMSPSHYYADTGMYTIMLTTTNASGCVSTFSQPYDIAYGKYDILLENISAGIDADDFLNVTVTFRNVSNRTLTSADFIVDIEGDQGFKEAWDSVLNSGASTTYALKTSTRLSTTTEHTYVCITAKDPDGRPDANPLNNELCVTLNNNQFILPNPSPNPTTGYITIPFIVPADGLVQITIYDKLGHKMNDAYQYSAKKGFNSLGYYTTNLAQGVYTYVITYNNSQAVKKFIRLDPQ